MRSGPQVTEIAPPKGFLAPIRGAWAHKDLVRFFAWRDLKVRYRQSLVGAGWALLQPLTLMAVFSLFLSGIVELKESVVSYPLFVFAGLVPWTLFSQSVTQSANAIVNNQELIRKASFNRLVLPVSAVGGYAVDFSVASVIAVIWSGVATDGLTLRTLALPLVGGLTVIASLGVGVGLSALNVRFRDIRFATPFLVQAWLFATPVIYPPDLAPDAARFFLYLNPMAGIVALYRWSLFGASIEFDQVLISAGISLFVLFISLVIFARSEPTFADTI